MLTRPLFFAIVLLMTFSPSTDAADNVFLPPGGGDLLDPANWSNGVAPTMPTDFGINYESGHQDFTVGSSGSSIQMGWLGNGIDASFDLQGRSVRAGLYPMITTPHTENWKFSNGHFLYDSRLLVFQSNPTQFNLEFSNFTWDGSIRATASNGNVVVDHESSISSLWLTGATQHVELKGKSSFLQQPTSPQNIRLEGSSSVSLIVGEGSSLGPGSYSLNGYQGANVKPGSAELVIKEASSSSPATYLGISPQSTILIDGNSTQAAFKNITISGFVDVNQFVTNTPTTTVQRGASMTVYGPAPQGEPEFLNPVTFSFLLGKLVIKDEQSKFESKDGRGLASHLEVIDGGSFYSQDEVSILDTLHVRNSIVNSSFEARYVKSTIFSFVYTNTSATIENGEIHGNLSDFRLVDLRDGLIQGNINAAKIIGNGLINGDITSSDSTSNIEIHPDGHIQITGDLTSSQLYFDIFSRDDFDSIDVDGSLQGQINWSLIDPYLPPLFFPPLPYFAIATNAVFADGFFASVGDRFVLLHYSGGTIQFDAPHRVPPIYINDESLQRDLLNITIDNLPDGYQIDVFLEDGDMGFTIVAVPEVSTALFIGIGLCPLIAIHRRKRLSANP